MPLPTPLDPAAFAAYVGEPLEVLVAAVAEQGGVVRVVDRDGQATPVTVDYAPTRVNVSVEGADSRVTAIIGCG